MLHTDLTRGLGIEHPIVSAGMARVSQADLVVAVSEAGGMGCLGGVSYLPDALGAEIRRVRARTDKPFAVDLVVSETLLGTDEAQWRPVRGLWEQLSPADRVKLTGVEAMFTPGAVRSQIEVVLKERPPVVALTFETPRHVVDACHERGIQVIALSGSVGRSVAAEDAGVDYVVAQGTEGGGHTGYVGTVALIPAVVDAVSIPVMAAGGIVDGRGLAAALCLGAAGAWCGTRFIASDEAYGHAAYKQRILEAAARDTVLSRAYTGKNLRTLGNEWTARWAAGEHSDVSFPGQYAAAGVRVESAYQDGELSEGMMPAGQGVGLVRAIMPAGEIVREMVAEAERVLGALAHSTSSISDR